MTSKPSWRAAEQLAVASFMTVELQARNARQRSAQAAPSVQQAEVGVITDTTQFAVAIAAARRAA
jgi:hypothetical protein